MITENEIRYLVDVLRCAVMNEAPPDMPDGLDVDEFFGFCRSHKVDNIVYMAIADKLNGPLKAKCDETYNQMLMLQATQQYYLEETEKAFEKNKIDYLVLKGRELAALYPSEDMRQSSDFDIYVGRENAPRCKDIMLSMGFDIEAYSDTDDFHDEYIIDKFVLCELHRVLIQNDHPWQDECNRIPERLIPCEGTEHRYRMSNEDFYVYNLAHMAKHMKFSGVGIRVFLDQWLIRKKLGDKIDWEKTDGILRLAHLYEFEQYARALYEYWFEGKEPNDISKVKEMERYVAESGWIGTYEQAKATEAAEHAGNNGSKNTAKLHKFMSIINSPYEQMKERYPILEKHRWMMPFCRGHRIIRAALFRRDLVKSISKEIENTDIDAGKKLIGFKKSIGL